MKQPLDDWLASKGASQIQRGGKQLWLCANPWRDDSSPSLVIGLNSDGRPFVHDRARKGDDKLWRKRALEEIDFGEWTPPDPRDVARYEKYRRDKAEAEMTCFDRWPRLVDWPGDLPWRYFEGRGLARSDIAAMDCIASAKFFPTTLYRGEERLPAIAAPYTDGAGMAKGYQATFLDGKTSQHVGDAFGISSRMNRGGDKKGLSLKCGQPAEVVALTEGLEDAMSFQLIEGVPAWAVGGTDYSGVELPSSVTAVIIAIDNDEAGRLSGRKEAEKLRRRGYSVHVSSPPTGQDYNAYLQSQLRN